MAKRYCQNSRVAIITIIKTEQEITCWRFSPNECASNPIAALAPSIIRTQTAVLIEN